jgi:hypothetical protein
MMSTTIDTSNVKAIIAKLSALKGSNNLADLIMNFKLLVLYVTHDEIEKIQEWLTAYDVQANMFVRGSLVSCTVHPSTLPEEEEELLRKEDIEALKDFVEQVRGVVTPSKIA